MSNIFYTPCRRERKRMSRSQNCADLENGVKHRLNFVFGPFQPEILGPPSLLYRQGVARGNRGAKSGARDTVYHLQNQWGWFPTHWPPSWHAWACGRDRGRFDLAWHWWWSEIAWLRLAFSMVLLHTSGCLCETVIVAIKRFKTCPRYWTNFSGDSPINCVLLTHLATMTAGGSTFWREVR